MSPMLLASLLSAVPGLLSSIIGGDPQKKLRKQLLMLASPQYQSKLTNQNYQTQIASPAYTQALGTIAAGGNATAGQIASELGARGIGQSGTGAILGSITPSIVGSQQAGLRSSAYNTAQNQTQSQIQQQIAALTGTQGPSQTQQFLGTGLEAMIPYLSQWFKSLGQRPGASFSPGQVGQINSLPDNWMSLLGR